jgi:hypothetical protein
MTRLRIVLRVLVWTAATLLAVIACAAIAVPIQQHLFRHRAEQLLADMQSIELHKTSWAQAQALMHRWGAWGNYDGACTWTNCKYKISLTEWTSYGRINEDETRFARLVRFLASTSVYRWLGGRAAIFSAGFIVQDGTIWRTFLAMDVDVPPRTLGNDDDMGYGLIAYAQSRASLNREARSRDSHWILGGDAQLADHPYYKGGRPGGCEVCMSVEVTYSTATPQDEIRKLTAFDLSCLTRWHPCTRVEDILPASKPWHLYSLEGDPLVTGQPGVQTGPCNIPVWALGRDAISVLSIDVLSATATRDPFDGALHEKARVRLIETLKGSAPWRPNAILFAYPYAGEQDNPPLEPPEHLNPGKRYLAVITYPFHEEGDPPEPPEINGRIPAIHMDRCGVLADTPENRLELQRGYAQNDSLRVPEF